MVIWILIMLVLVIFNILAVNLLMPDKCVDYSRTILLIAALGFLYKCYKDIKSRFG